MRKADNLPPSCAVVTKSGNLYFLESSRPVQACNGSALTLPLLFRTFYYKSAHTQICYRLKVGGTKQQIDSKCEKCSWVPHSMTPLIPIWIPLILNDHETFLWYNEYWEIWIALTSRSLTAMQSIRDRWYFRHEEQFICSTESEFHVAITNSRATLRTYLRKQSCQLRIQTAQENSFSQFYSFSCTQGHRR